jgi:hypothetical protein
MWVSPPMLQEQMFGSKIVRTIVAGNAMGEMPQQKEMARFKVRELQRTPLHRTCAIDRIQCTRLDPHPRPRNIDPC